MALLKILYRFLCYFYSVKIETLTVEFERELYSVTEANVALGVCVSFFGVVRSPVSVVVSTVNGSAQGNLCKKFSYVAN